MTTPSRGRRKADTAKRSIYFFRIDGGAGGDGVPINVDLHATLQKLDGLPFRPVEDGGRYVTSGDADQCVWVDEDNLDAPGMRCALPGLLAALDALRAIDVSGTTGPAGSWAQALLAISRETARVPGWRSALAASAVGTGPFDRGYARLRELAEGLPEERYVIHGDLLNRNVLVQGSWVTAVIDWGNALYGDWLYDAAWLIFWWPWFPQWHDIDINAELERRWEQQDDRPPDLHQRLQACLVHIGLDAIAYSAFRGRWDDLTRTASQISRLI